MHEYVALSYFFLLYRKNTYIYRENWPNKDQIHSFKSKFCKASFLLCAILVQYLKRKHFVIFRKTLMRVCLMKYLNSSNGHNSLSFSASFFSFFLSLQMWLIGVQTNMPMIYHISHWNMPLNIILWPVSILFINIHQNLFSVSQHFLLHSYLFMRTYLMQRGLHFFFSFYTPNRQRTEKQYAWMNEWNASKDLVYITYFSVQVYLFIYRTYKCVFVLLYAFIYTRVCQREWSSRPFQIKSKCCRQNGSSWTMEAVVLVRSTTKQSSTKICMHASIYYYYWSTFVIRWRLSK